MDDLLYMLIAVVSVCISGVAAFYFWLASARIASERIARVDHEAAERKAAASERKSSYRKAEAAAEQVVAPWVVELLGLFELTPAALFDAAGGSSISEFLPLIKGFIAMNPGI